MSNQMGEVRSLLHEPNDASWPQLIEILEKWPDEKELFDVVLPYCHAIINDWPAEIPMKVSSALSDALHGYSIPNHLGTRRLAIASLARDAYRRTFYGSDFAKNPKTAFKMPPKQPNFKAEQLALHLDSGTTEAIEYMASHDFPNLQSLAISSPSKIDKGATNALSKAPWFGPKLKRLWIRAQNEVVLQLFENKNVDLSSLMVLDLSNAEGGIEASGLRALLDTLKPGQLVELDCFHAWLEPDSAEIIATHPTMSNVRELDMRSNAYIGRAGLSLLENSTVLTQSAKDCLEIHYDNIFE